MPLLSLLAAGVMMQGDRQVVYLWPDGAPGSESRKAEAETRPHPWSIANIHNPSITVYKADKPNGCAVVIAPGGGFRELVIDEEGTKPALFLNKLGVTCFVLRYRLPREDGSKLDIDKVPPMDAYRAMRVVRSRASEWAIDSKRIGFLGFSAGGEMASLVAFGPEGDASATDPLERLSVRPNFCAWIYPGPRAIPDLAPPGSPDAFTLVANDDGLTEASLKLVKAYRAANLPIEAHILAVGGHGFNMGDRSKLKSVSTWPERLSEWLEDRGYLAAK